MKEKEKRTLVTSTGRELLEEGLVARTWGNVSCRLDTDTFLITPSGLAYTETTDEDLAIYNLTSKEWTGPHKPSSEKGVHASAYEIFPEVNFVIHTHQVFASAIGVYGFEKLDITEEERKQLGGIAKAQYGLPGTGKLKKAVRKAMETGAHTILMQNHGAVVAGSSKEDAFAKIRLLEEICKRNCKGLETNVVYDQTKRDGILENLQKNIPFIGVISTQAVLLRAKSGLEIVAQLDDMAQMIGRKIPVLSSEDQIKEALKTGNAVLVPNLGAFVVGKDADDTEALKILVDKAAVTAIHTTACKVNKKLSFFDCKLMYMVYQKKYSKQKHK